MGLIQLGKNYTSEEQADVIRDNLYEISFMIGSHLEKSKNSAMYGWYKSNVYELPECWVGCSDTAKRAFYANIMTVTQVADWTEKFLFYFDYPDAMLFEEFLSDNKIDYEIVNNSSISWVTGFKIKVDII